MQNRFKLLFFFGLMLSLPLKKLNAQVRYMIQDKAEKSAERFPLENVRLLESPFKKAMANDEAYLLRLSPDRFLHRFRLNAGLKPKGELYGGWEAEGVSGHSLGHYMSACAMMFAATGDTRFKERTDYIVQELAECQTARKTGYVGGIPNEDKIFREVANGDIRSQGFDLNGGWVPWYTEHKILAGLIDIYRYTGNNQAKEVASSFCTWIDKTFSHLSEAQFQKMLECEHGGMTESLADMYAITGNKKFLELSYRFTHQKLMRPLSRRQDSIMGLHANTQIPKIIGSARQYELTANRSDRTVADFFWNTVVDHYSYVIGGNSDHERFSPRPDHLSAFLSDMTTETCNSYNMLKLTGHLYQQAPKAAYMDHYERVLYNHILASQNPESGMVLYYMPLASGTEKKFGTPEDSFWCCTGTGMENHAKYGMDIYYRNKAGGLYVNLFIPSELDWKEKNLKWAMRTLYPESGSVQLAVTAGKSKTVFPVMVRYPKWATKGVTVKLNGKKTPVTARPGEYIILNRKWAVGDIIDLNFPMSLYTESMPDDKQVKAILYGPLVLAGELGKGGLNKRDIPVFVSQNPQVQTLVQPDAAKPNVFYASANNRQVTLEPLYKVYNQKQQVYWQFFSPETWTKQRQVFEAERKAEDELARRTIDVMFPGEMQAERDHGFNGEHTNTGDVNGKRWRDAVDGGWFSFNLETKGHSKAELQCTYLGSDGGGREFDILVDGQKIATEKLTVKEAPDFYFKVYPVPSGILAGKTSITVRFQALSGKTAGGVFGCRLISPEKEGVK